MKKFLLLMVLLIVFGEVSAQKTLYLKPFIGVQNPLIHYDKKLGLHDAITLNSFQPTENYGFLLEMPLNQQWTLAAGWSIGRTGWAYEEYLAIGNNNFVGLEAKKAFTIHRFPVMAKMFLNGNPEKEQRSVALKFYLQGGVSIDFLPGSSEITGTDTTQFFFSSGDHLINYEKIKVLHKWSGSANIGLGTQLYIKGKPRLDVSLIYSLGLRNSLQVDLDTDLSGQKVLSRLYSRGSYAGLTVGIPIRLKTFGEKHM